MIFFWFFLSALFAQKRLIKTSEHHQQWMTEDQVFFLRKSLFLRDISTHSQRSKIHGCYG